MEIQVLPDNLKYIVQKNLRELQSNIDKRFNDIGKTIQNQNENFSKELENIKNKFWS